MRDQSRISACRRYPVRKPNPGRCVRGILDRLHQPPSRTGRESPELFCLQQIRGSAGRSKENEIEIRESGKGHGGSSGPWPSNLSREHAQTVWRLNGNPLGSTTPPLRKVACTLRQHASQSRDGGNNSTRQTYQNTITSIRSLFLRIASTASILQIG